MNTNKNDLCNVFEHWKYEFKFYLIIMNIVDRLSFLLCVFDVGFEFNGVLILNALTYV